MFLEKPLDAFRSHSLTSLLLEASGDLLKAQSGILDIFH